MTEERKEYIITKVEKNELKDEELKKQLRIRKIFIVIMSLCVLLNSATVVTGLVIGRGILSVLWNMFSGGLCGVSLWADIKLKKKQEAEKLLNELETESLINELESDELEKKLGLK